MAWNENLLKGRMAESLVEELLKRAGNKVFRFGYEAVLQNLTQLEGAFDGECEVGQQIRSIPDFLVLNESGKPFFVEVKFRAVVGGKEMQALLEKIGRYWTAKVVVVTVRKPYFLVAGAPSSDGHSHFDDLENDQDLNVRSDALAEFNRLVENYFGKTCCDGIGEKHASFFAKPPDLPSCRPL